MLFMHVLENPSIFKDLKIVKRCATKDDLKLYIYLEKGKFKLRLNYKVDQNNFFFKIKENL